MENFKIFREMAIKRNFPLCLAKDFAKFLRSENDGPSKFLNLEYTCDRFDPIPPQIKFK